MAQGIPPSLPWSFPSVRLSSQRTFQSRLDHGLQCYWMCAGSFAFCLFPLKFQPLPTRYPPGAVVSSRISSFGNKPQLSAGNFHPRMQPSRPCVTPTIRSIRRWLLPRGSCLHQLMSFSLLPWLRSSASPLCPLSLLGLLPLLPKSETFPPQCLAHWCLLASNFYLLPRCLTPRFVNLPPSSPDTLSRSVVCYSSF